MKEKLASCRGQEGRTPRVNPLQLRNAITHEKPTSAGLMYVEIVLNEMATLLVRWSIRGGRHETRLLPSKGKVKSKEQTWQKLDMLLNKGGPPGVSFPIP